MSDATKTLRKPTLATVGSRAVIYIRQSTYREESISEELQESAGRDYCRERGYDVVAVKSDPGISGRTWNRPAVKEVMRMIESREADIIVLWKWSRLSRSRLDWAVAADKVETVGGRIESATEPLDVTTATGRFARGMLTEFAAFESERIGDVWKETQERRVRMGLTHNGGPRFGYVQTADGYDVDAVDGPILAEMYQRYLSGHSIRSICSWLNEHTTARPSQNGKPSAPIRPWTATTIRRQLDSGFAAGYVRRKGEYLPGKHPPLITLDEWEAYQVASTERNRRPRAESSPHVLSGIIYCQCGSRMYGSHVKDDRSFYSCAEVVQRRAHTGGKVKARYVEREVFEWLKAHAAKIDDPAAHIEHRMPHPSVESEIAATEQKLVMAANRLDNATTRVLDGLIPDDVYQRLLPKLQTEQNELAERLRALKVRARGAQPDMLIPKLVAQWDHLTMPERREMLRQVIDRIVVTSGKPKATIEIFGR